MLQPNQRLHGDRVRGFPTDVPLAIAWHAIDTRIASLQFLLRGTLEQTELVNMLLCTTLLFCLSNVHWRALRRLPFWHLLKYMRRRAPTKN